MLGFCRKNVFFDLLFFFSDILHAQNQMSSRPNASARRPGAGASARTPGASTQRSKRLQLVLFQNSPEGLNRPDLAPKMAFSSSGE